MNTLIVKVSLVLCFAIAIVMLLSFIVRLNSTPLNTKLPENIEQRGFNNTIQLNILNACGKAGIASKARNHLRKLGFDVVEIGNYEQEVESTFVIDRLGDRTSSYKLCRSIGLTESNIKSEIDSSLYLRATLVIGKDFEELRINL